MFIVAIFCKMSEYMHEKMKLLLQNRELNVKIFIKIQKDYYDKNRY